MFEAEPVVAVEFEARAGRAEIAAGLAAGVVARRAGGTGSAAKTGSDRLTPHHASVWVAGRRLTSIRRADGEQPCPARGLP